MPGKPTDIRIREIRSETEKYLYRSPMKFGGRVVTDVVLLHVTATVETRDGRVGTGRGSMTMGNAWAWPSAVVPADKTLEALIRMGQLVAERANHYQEIGHPLEMTYEYAKTYEKLLAEPNMEKTYQVTQKFAAFKDQTTDGIARCRIRSVMLPLFTDHLLREANHYLRMLGGRVNLIQKTNI